MTRLLPFLILPLAVLLLQHQSVQFWHAAITGHPLLWGWSLLAEPWAGWGWSVLLEAVNLWAWLEVPRAAWSWRDPFTNGWHLLAGVTTALLVAGPLYNVSQPLFAREWAQAGLDARIEQVVRLQERFSAANAQGRRVGALMDQADARLGALMAQRYGFGPDSPAPAVIAQAQPQSATQRRLMLLAQLALIVVAQIGVLVSLVRLGRPRDAWKDTKKQELQTAWEEAMLATGPGPAQHPLKAWETTHAEAIKKAWADVAEGGRTLLFTKMAAGAGPVSTGAETPASKMEHTDRTEQNHAGNGKAAVETPAETSPAEDLTEAKGRALLPRVTAVRAALVQRYPGKTMQQLSDELPASRRDLSLLVNHERRMLSGERLISENQLAALEALARGERAAAPRPAE